MFHATMSAAIGGATTLAQMDALSRQIWQAHASRAVTDDEAQGLAELLHSRRGAIREAVTPVGIPLGRVTLFPPKRAQRAPERSEAISRRRRLAFSGPMPPALGSRFTTGQLAVLQIIGNEMVRNGACGLCIDAIAAQAGVCRRLAQGAIRLAEGDGLLTIQERRHQGRKSDPNVVRIISREWLQWLRRGSHGRQHPKPGSATAPTASVGIGCKSIHPTDKGITMGTNRPADPAQGCRGAAVDPDDRDHAGIRVRGRAGRAMR